MEKEKIVLINPQLEKEPLYLDFKNNIHSSYLDLIVCEIPLDIAYIFLEQQDDIYFEEHIKVNGEVKKYLLNLKKDIEKEEKMWDCIERTEDVFRRMKGEK